ncbi:Efflux pump atB [Paramyrothecium foliicola]|nr:Efflux pump atB [Paramyrothecium foliicola]
MAFSLVPATPQVQVMLAFIVVVQVLVAITIGLRFRLRWVARAKYSWDDWLAVVSGVFVSTAGIGYESHQVAGNLSTVTQLIFAYELIYHCTIGTAKLSALCFYLRAFESHYIHKYVIAAIGLVCAQTLAVILWSLLVCQPISRFWTENDGDFCGNRRPMYVTASVLAIVTDILIVGLPIPVILGLKIKRSKKKAIIGLFSTAVLMTIVSVVRIFSITWIDEGNVTATAAPFMFFSALEPCVATLCVCLPMLSPLFNRCFGKRTGNTPPNPLSTAAREASSRTKSRPGFSRLEDGTANSHEMFNRKKAQSRVTSRNGLGSMRVKTSHVGHEASGDIELESRSQRSGSQSELVVSKLVYAGILLGTLYLFFGAFPLVFHTAYEMDTWQVGLTFTGIAVGMCIATCCSPLWVFCRLRLIHRSNPASGKSEPEYRLVPGILGSVMVPVGLFIFSWTSISGIHWMVPIIGSGLFGCGQILVFTGIFTFLVDAYPKYAASALASNGLFRTSFAGTFNTLEY